MYDGDIEYASSRLDQSVVRHLDVPVMVGPIDRDGSVSLTRLSDGHNYVAKLEELNLIPVDLGYVNYDNAAHYVMRKPIRRDWRQGLRHNNMVVRNGVPAGTIPWSNIAKTINNEYPTFEDARLMMKGKRQLQSIAWCRDFCIYRGWEVVYCDDVVGKVIEGKVVLNEGFTYLKEALAETL